MDLTAKEIFDQFKIFNKKFTLFSGQCEMVKNENGKFIFKDFKLEENMFSSTSYIDEDLINERFDGETEFDTEEFNELKQEGFYVFECLLSFSEAQYGNYPPPNCEVQAYYEIEYIEFEFIADSINYSDEAPDWLEVAL